MQVYREQSWGMPWNIAIVLELKIGRGGKEYVIKDWSLGIEAELGKYEKVVEESGESWNKS